MTTTTTQIPAPNETRGVMPRKVVWMELPAAPGGEREPDQRMRMPVYDPSALCEECERWDGMA